MRQNKGQAKDSRVYRRQTICRLQRIDYSVQTIRYSGLFWDNKYPYYQFYDTNFVDSRKCINRRGDNICVCNPGFEGDGKVTCIADDICAKG